MEHRFPHRLRSLAHPVSPIQAFGKRLVFYVIEEMKPREPYDGQ